MLRRRGVTIAEVGLRCRKAGSVWSRVGIGSGRLGGSGNSGPRNGLVWPCSNGRTSSKVLSAIKTDTDSPLSLSRIVWAVRSTGETFVARESCGRLSLTGACVMSAVAQNQQARVEVGRCIRPACHSLIALQCIWQGRLRTSAPPRPRTLVGWAGRLWRDGARALQRGQ